MNSFLRLVQADVERKNNLLVRAHAALDAVLKSNLGWQLKAITEADKEGVQVLAALQVETKIKIPAEVQHHEQ